MPRVTLQTIADEAGVTKTTVSLALRNDPRISDAVRIKLQDLAKEMGYTPNPLVSSLMTQVQSGRPVSAGSTLALLAPHENEQKAKDSPYDYCRSVYKGLRNRAEALGYHVDIVEPADDKNDFSVCARMMTYRGIRGVVLPPFIGPALSIPVDFDRSPFAVVAVGHSQDIRQCHRVAHNQFQIAHRLVAEMIHIGRRRIGMHLSDEMNPRAGFQYSGSFLGALHDSPGIAVSRSSILYNPAQDPDKFLAWFRKHRFDGLVSQFVADHNLLNRHGVHIPQDLSFALLSTSGRESTMSGCFHDPGVLASAAIDLVTAHIQRNEVGIPEHPKTMLLPETWVEGKTI